MLTNLLGNWTFCKKKKKKSMKQNDYCQSRNLSPFQHLLGLDPRHFPWASAHRHAWFWVCGSILRTSYASGPCRKNNMGNNADWWCNFKVLKKNNKKNPKMWLWSIFMQLHEQYLNSKCINLHQSLFIALNTRVARRVHFFSIIAAIL